MKSLSDYIAEHLATPFCWGKQDCCTFTVGWIENVTGQSLLERYRPWSTAMQATRKLTKGGGIEKMFFNGLQSITPNSAKDGDVTIVNGIALIFTGSQIVSTGENGLLFLDRMEAKSAWKVSN